MRRVLLLTVAFVVIGLTAFAAVQGNRGAAAWTTLFDGKSLAVDEKAAARSSKDLKLPVRVPLQLMGQGAANLHVQVTLFYCREDNTGTCRIKTLVWNAPVQVTTDTAAPTELRLQGKLTAD